jgi:hypothetical protein
VEHGKDGFGTRFEFGDAGLELQNMGAQGEGGASGVLRRGSRIGEGSGCGSCLNIETGSEGAVTGTGEDDGADVWVVGKFGEDGGEVEPHTGRVVSECFIKSCTLFFFFFFSWTKEEQVLQS